jgi:hypothetical protein
MIGRTKEQDTSKFWATTKRKKNMNEILLFIPVGLKSRDEKSFCNNVFKTEIMEAFLLAVVILFSPLINTQEYFS